MAFQFRPFWSFVPLVVGWVAAVGLAVALVLQQPSQWFVTLSTLSPLQIQSLPSVQYEAETNTIQLGTTSADQPASEAITVPQLAAQLETLGLSPLLTLVDTVDVERIWLLKANLVIERSARLDVTDATIDWLRLASPAAAPVVVTVRRGGHLFFDGVKVTSWDSGTGDVDTTVGNGRSYLLALEGARMDLLRTEAAYLGAASGEPSGLSWRKRLHDDDPTTGATGRVEESEIHHNYFGLYTYEAYGMKILNNKVHSNLYYGIDPHDDSQNLEVAYNEVYGNGTHGIIFSRRCINNEIHHNLVYDNAQHGIMLDRGTNNNRVYENTVYGNQDGIAIYQSSDNLIYNNIIRENRRGVRINATYDADDPYDGLAANNQIYDNQILDNSEHGLYLYARADRNSIRNNQILRSELNGIYIKSGGNQIIDNTIQSGNVGIAIVGGEYMDDPPEAMAALDPPGHNNVIVGTTVSLQRDVGIRLLGAGHTHIGPTDPGNSGQGNQIVQNGKDGIAIGDATNGAAATDNLVQGNTIHNNTRHGVLVTDATSVRNRISRNSITGNGQLGIKVDKAAQAGLAPPAIITTAPDYIRGTAPVGARIEVYSDPGDSGQRLLTQVPAALGDLTNDSTEHVQATSAGVYFQAYSLTDYEGQTYLGETTADGEGVWSFTLAAAQDPEQISVLAIDEVGNTSAFSGSLKGSANATYDVKADENGNTTIYVSGIGAAVTLQDIADNLGAADASLLQNVGNGIWQLNANLFLEIGVIFTVSADDGVQELRLRSEASAITTIDYASFVYIRSYNGEINIDGVKLYSWDPGTQTVDEDPQNGRAYLLAKYDAIMNIRNADIGYLGSSDGESYGLTWRDVNDDSTPEVLRTRATGEVVNSKIHHNYYGIYTFQASDMLFRGNKFYSNVRYGFDPHDFSHDFLVEDNEAYDNGAHGFILSRGCNNFTVRNNKSYNNSDPSPSSLAHGFMLDPGSPNSRDPQAPSYDNLFVDNVAYDNEGYGMRILDSHTNEMRNNHFHHNEIGISLEEGSTDNFIVNNNFSQNTRYGIFLQETADKNIVRNNVVEENGDNGIYVRSNEHEIIRNEVNTNGKAGIALLIKTGFDAPRANQILSNTVSSNLENGIDLRTAEETLIVGNVIIENRGDGIYLKDGTTGTAIIKNVIAYNDGYGIELNGITTQHNYWSQNQIYGNGRGGISAGGGALLPAQPILQDLTTNTLSGTATSDTTVEFYADLGNQGQYYLGSTAVDAEQQFSFTYEGIWPAPNLFAVAIYGDGSASDFSAPLVVGTAATPTPTTTPGTPTPTVTPTATSAPNRSIYLPYIESSP